MSCDVAELERGSVCVALYPFTTGFPMDRVVRDAENELLAQLERLEDIDAIQATIKADDPPPEIVGQWKLRRVLLLQDGTHAGIQDIAVARVNSVTEAKKARERWYQRITARAHPTQLHLKGDEHQGTRGQEAYVDLMSVATIRKATILRREGRLTEDEMRDISERLITSLEIDVSGYVERLASDE